MASGILRGTVPRIVIGAAEDQVRPPRQCNCKRSNCLKLYCECFAGGQICTSKCRCQSCYNNTSFEKLRTDAVEQTLEKNVNAFRPKIAASWGESKSGPVSAAIHNRGCACKKSNCLKKYCECYQAEIACSKRCKCLECKNTEPAHKLRVAGHVADTSTNVFWGDGGKRAAARAAAASHATDPFADRAGLRNGGGGGDSSGRASPSAAGPASSNSEKLALLAVQKAAFLRAQETGDRCLAAAAAAAAAAGADAAAAAAAASAFGAGAGTAAPRAKRLRGIVTQPAMEALCLELLEAANTPLAQPQPVSPHRGKVLWSQASSAELTAGSSSAATAARGDRNGGASQGGASSDGSHNKEEQEPPVDLNDDDGEMLLCEESGGEDEEEETKMSQALEDDLGGGGGSSQRSDAEEMAARELAVVQTFSAALRVIAQRAIERRDAPLPEEPALPPLLPPLPPMLLPAVALRQDQRGLQHPQQPPQQQVLPGFHAL